MSWARTDAPRFKGVHEMHHSVTPYRPFPKANPKKNCQTLTNHRDAPPQ